ncbi:MAG: hypothetical protein DRH12_11775 [Deltaproteobacteria bacterium]|nr:MAG: hypothetical protein DRH12_11775 [Deltaproteobacteria bacterium]
MWSKLSRILILVGIAVALLASISIPKIQAEEDILSVGLLDFIGSREYLQCQKDEVYKLWSRWGDRGQSSHAEWLSFPIRDGNPETDAVVYGTGKLDTKPKYMVGVKVSFELCAWGSLRDAVVGLFGRSNDNTQKGIAHFSIMIKGPGY